MTGLAFRCGVVLLAVLLAGCSPAIAPSATSSDSPLVTCVPEGTPEPSSSTGDTCSSGVEAALRLVSGLGRVVSLYLAPGPFDCGYPWPGDGIPRGCPQPSMLPGQFLHGWVTFVGTGMVAAIGLFRPVGDGGPVPSTLPAWQAGVDAFEVPPTGWHMP